MKIIKSNGKKESFSEKKLRLSLKRSGASFSIIEDMMPIIRRKLYDGMSTKELYDLVETLLKKKDACSQCRYNLRMALLRFGPAGYNFEKYIVSILRQYDYVAFNPEKEIRGACVFHEVDVIAKKKKETIFIETKFRHAFQDIVTLKDVMATYARVLDLNEGKELFFDEAWIITNARFSDRGQTFGFCKGMKLIGWSTSKEETLGQMVDHVGMYPVTVLDLQKHEVHSLARNGIMLCKEVAHLPVHSLKKLLQTSQKRAAHIHSLCERISQG